MLGEHGADARAEGCKLQLTAVVRSEEKKRNGGHHVAESGGGFQAIHFGHGEIENDQVGGELLGFLNSVHSVNCFAANGEFGKGIEKRTELPTDYFMIVHEQN